MCVHVWGCLWVCGWVYVFRAPPPLTTTTHPPPIHRRVSMCVWVCDCGWVGEWVGEWVGGRGKEGRGRQKWRRKRDGEAMDARSRGGGGPRGPRFGRPRGNSTNGRRHNSKPCVDCWPGSPCSCCQGGPPPRACSCPAGGRVAVVPESAAGARWAPRYSRGPWRPWWVSGQNRTFATRL